jgi:hypothetical protein
MRLIPCNRAIAGALLDYRLEHKIPRNAFAALVGVRPQAIGRMERGQVLPRHERLALRNFHSQISEFGLADPLAD